MVYYGLSLNTGSLVGDPHLMLFISGIIEVPAYILSAKIIDVLGRRSVISFCLVSGGLVCICTTYFPQSIYIKTSTRYIYAMMDWIVTQRYFPFLFCLVLFSSGSFAWTTSTTCVVMLGKSLISISFAIIYNYTAELFPTVSEKLCFYCVNPVHAGFRRKRKPDEIYCYNHHRKILLKLGNS